MTRRRAMLAGAAGAAVLGLWGCSSAPRNGPSARPPAPAVPFPQGNDVAIQALGLVGTPYRLGGNDLDQGVDCSAFIGLVYRRATGLPLPRTVALMQLYGRAVERDDAAPGDIVLFTPERASVPTHGGVVVGGGRFVHAPSTGGRVRVDSLALPHWARQRWTVRRP